ncbi:MAG: hypothetical protein IPN10_16860 [Saprospiraceae bacterium]|nr:hypothetical protein [Saprospiraceae bacterium]
MKMAFRQFVLSLIILILFFNFISAQTHDKICGTIFYPGVNKEGIDFEAEFEQWMRDKVRELQSGSRTFNSYTIPVIFHVIHNGEQVGQGSNLHGDKIMANLEQLNLDFANQSGSMEESAADMQIQFCPAVIDTDGNLLSETGIDRINRNEMGWLEGPYTRDSTWNIIVYETIWNPNDYLNIWVLDFEIEGEASFPVGSGLNGLGSFETDVKAGVCVKNSTIGSIEAPGTHWRFPHGRALTHEIGHFFGLLHIWGNRPACCKQPNQCYLPNVFCYCKSDYCEDTPTQQGPTINISCPNIENEDYIQNCPNLGEGSKRMFENYMDYSYDICMNTFTLDQKNRAQIVMQNSPRRVSLATSNKCCELADLTILMPSVTNPYTHPDSSIQVFFAVNNNGASAAPPFHISFHLSTDPVLTPGSNGDTYLGEYFVSQSLGALSQTILLNHSLVIPNNMTSGTYYLFYSADGGQVVDECDEDNNFATVIIHVSANPSVAQESWQYWFDNNYSFRILTKLTPGLNDYNIQNNISTSFLDPGLHSFNFQFLDSNHVQSSIISSFFYKSNDNFPAGSPKYQQWIDDYENHGTTNIQSTSHFILNENLDLEELEDGLHTFNIRFKIDGKHWSSVNSSFFYKPKSIPIDTPRYEYWLDQNYASKVTVNNPSANNFILLQNMNFDTLSEGLHTFNIRFKPVGKTWSSISSSFFYKIKPELIGQAKYQYWYDGNVQDSITVNTTSINNFILLDSMDSMPLSEGLHTFNIRFKPTGELWSPVNTSFFVRGKTTTATEISKCLYWFDDDFNNNNTIFYSDSSNVFDIIYANTPGLDNGEHTLSMFFMDNAGMWSSIVKDTFIKDTTLPIQCPNNQEFVSGLGNPYNMAYQWQVDNGSGFINVSNSTNYSGTNSDTLVITNPPTNWYNNIYRCQVTLHNNTLMNGPSYPLKFIYIWTGLVDNNWENPSNWNCTGIPTQNSDVIINTGTANVNSNVDVGSITSGSNSVLNINDGFEVKIKRY